MMGLIRVEPADAKKAPLSNASQPSSNNLRGHPAGAN
jgi:hypothetical protein